MNLEFYLIIGDSLLKGINKAYRRGIASIVNLNKKEILRLSDEPELFKINYTGADKTALMNFKVEAFTVAGVMSYELEEKLKRLALDLQEGNHPLAKGEKDIKKVWVAEAYNIMSDYIPIPDMPPPRFLNTNLRTAMQSSYHAAQYIRLQDDSVKKLYPAYQYKTLNDNRVREEHRSLHDMIWRNDDPVWDKIWPPNGWNCRCYVTPLSQEEVDNSAVQPKTVTEVGVNEIVSRGKIGKDFQRNAGKRMSIWGGWLKSKIKNLPNDVSDYIFKTTNASKYYDDNLVEFKNAKKEIDKLADDLAGEKGYVIKADLKTRQRFISKAVNEYGGDAAKVTDVVRNTIVVNSITEAKEVISKIRRRYKGKLIKDKEFLEKPNNVGYTGSLFVIKTSNGQHGEVQVNLRKTLIAKDSTAFKNLSSKQQVGMKKSLEKITGSKNFPIGIGHWFYEIGQMLDNSNSELRKELTLDGDSIQKISADIKEASSIYYSVFSKLPDNLELYSSSEISSAKSAKAFERILGSVTKDLVWGLKTVESSGRSTLSLIKYPTSAVSKYLNLDFILDN